MEAKVCILYLILGTLMVYVDLPYLCLMMMMNLFVVKNVLELWIDKYLLIYVMTGSFLAIY